ncbi:hypothetical protein B0I35DRAFT_410772 [Stachybotrys elegans]|uniref:DUF6594 domain-containing protein n=1 Tax=Stachybotrys elegans TaxID=80388 RepID=A0A8K0WPI0_9HYPO|nr:hypothetical protein B0I35DRAFT_410772 [Stachybotrys elegans]
MEGVSRRGTAASTIPEESEEASVRNEESDTSRRQSYSEEEAPSIRDHITAESNPPTPRRVSSEDGHGSVRYKYSALGDNPAAAGTREHLPEGVRLRLPRSAGNDSDRWIIDHHRVGFIKAIKRKKNRVWLPSGKGRKSASELPAAEPFDIEADVEKDMASPTSSGNGTANVKEKKKKEWKRPSEERTFRINLAELQRMRLRKLQWRLVRHVKNLNSLLPNEKEPESWETDLENYIKAVKDYDYMVQCKELPRDPFLVTGERKIDDYVIRTIWDKLRDDDYLDPEITDTAWEEDNAPIGGTRGMTARKSWFSGFKTRLGMAALGAFFLIAPMWLMVLHNTLYTGLASTTVFVGVFGVILALYSDSPKDVLSGTAGYAAVLVVFVGLGLSDSG